ncbi:PTS sugar transporter subunit IIB [Agromyces aerolatus]|uniref:PTS sugar transporter subunit IIB n=1 Tax=Agromyces sp. LY-1074 TaxID=3074080 RepID=UPI00285C7EA2|nr:MULTISPECIES: PTS IIB subunit [unclassified Agromyces]MDR5698380.1 PTS IIB subunit [Agromyces sp. LY-1074]MDR5704674.1 PTS IIB subunit [Agromyces sp. LY-1358]
MRVIVVCGAGASSTFVAHRLRRTAASRGVTLEARPTSTSQLAAELEGADVLLVGAHLGAQLHELRALADAASVPIAILPETAASGDGTAALDLALEAAGAAP